MTGNVRRYMCQDDTGGDLSRSASEAQTSREGRLHREVLRHPYKKNKQHGSPAPRDEAEESLSTDPEER